MRVVVGIGSPLRGDDYVGPYVAKRVRFSKGIDAGTAPEIVIPVVRRMRPEEIVFVDAALMGLSPGEIRILEPHELVPGMVTTHSIPMGMLLEMLDDLASAVTVIGVQPKTFEGYMRLSPPVREAARRLIEMLDSGDYRSIPRLRAGPPI
ncbi:MAG: hydrogenase 3 maturation endopeptidase HyCI [Thermoplasmata archaeon]|nr:MAG: hydrogenase 3 maturation endopeptidase HyCI [Thermoplasmata archaeon]HDJ26811.1 hydrogenase 3 maturation endopeptidase HyCI [Aciduliprofundum sp.]